jgi:hypothetical protein
MNMRLNGFKLSTLFALGLILLASTPQAYGLATLRLNIDGGGAEVTCADGALCDLNTAAGAVTVSTAVGDFAINVTTGLSKPVFAQPMMDLNSVNIQTTGGAHTLTLEFSDDNFTVPSPAFSLLFGGTLSGAGAVSVGAAAYLSEANTLFAQDTLIGTVGPFGPGAFSGTATGPGTADTSFALTQIITLVTNGPTNFSGDFELSPVPEPTSVALFGGVMLLTGAAIRRKLSNVKA